MKFSIIIPCREKTKYLEECVKKIKEMNYSDYEIIIVPDKKIKMKNTKILPFKGGPAEKRDYAAKKAKGEILAFIDDDAYPDKDWLKNSLKYFKKGYSSVGGPAVTPENNSFMQKASGFILSSKMMGGLKARYEPVKDSFEIDDWPTVNFLVKKKIFQKIGGFNTHYYPGEDTKLCLDIINLDEKIAYAPDVIVYHHRRPLFKKHLKQISNYGFHRGLFAKKFPKTSFKLSYFLPSLFLIFVVFGGILSIINTIFLTTYLIIISSYLLTSLIISFMKFKKITMSLIVSLGILLTHLFYGANFIKGLIAGKVRM